MPLAITENAHVHDKWYEDAKAIKSPDELKAFAERLVADYEHDYGTICHALAACAIAGAYCMEHSPQGGITGFQAGAVMWEFMEHWNGPIAPARLLKYEDALYPQYESKFHSIGKSTWEWMQTRAKQLLLEDPANVHRDVHRHWESIANGVVPFGLSIEND